LTKNDRRYARHMGPLLAARSGGDPDEAKETALAYMQRVGAARFRGEVKVWRDLIKTYQADVAEGAHISRGADFLDALSGDEGFPEVAWYWYH
jgi:hypothetical protein